MDLKFYLAMLWRNKWVIIITTFVTVAVVATLTLLNDAYLYREGYLAGGNSRKRIGFLHRLHVC